MVSAKELTGYLNQYLDVDSVKDYCPNGLQIQGKETISILVTGVSANLALLQKASELSADAVLVHHGLFWVNSDPKLVGTQFNKIKCIVENGINLFAYHLPLDTHENIGNNALFAERLNFQCTARITVSNIKNLLCIGGPSSPISALELKAQIKKTLDREPLHIPSDLERRIEKVAWCTGAGQDFIEKASEFGAQAYITGEISERTVHLAKELNLDFYAAGHHATERFGVNALGNHIANIFGIKHQYVDIPNPV